MGQVPSLPLPPPLLLELNLAEPPVDPDVDDPLARWSARSRRQLRPTVRALYEAGADRRVAGLVVKVGAGGLGWPAMQELRLGIQAFRESGKPTLAWAESLDGPGALAAYVLASACEQIWLQPGGELGALGIGVETTFLRGTLDKLGVRPEFEQRREYKNAPDLFQRTGFTEAHREAVEAVAESLYADAVTDIAGARGLSAERVAELLDQGPHTAAAAREHGLVDRLGFRDQVWDTARNWSVEEAQLLFADRWRPRRRLRSLPRPWQRGHVALVDVRGTIASGRSRRLPTGRVAGSDTVAAQLRAAREDPHARAVLLRVDSPGGSAVASEVIWREVSRLREAGTPVVVSMGSLAASGGYYVACAADTILALPATLTGSIGVFGGKLVLTDLLARIGVSTGTVQRGEHALMYSARRGFSAGERDRLSALIDAVYDDFVAKVAAGRGRSAEEIEVLARGRVWTGRAALANGLVDRLGGMREAATVARERGGLPSTAPVVPALRIPLWARLSRPRNSDDPRAWARVGASGAVQALADLDRAMATGGGLGLVERDLARLLAPAGDAAVWMPPIRLS